MTFNDPGRLQSLTNFETLLDYLRDDLGWPIEVDDLGDATFDYSADELGINPRYAARIVSIKQLRPLVDQQVWGIFFIEFDNNRLPVMALRRILTGLTSQKRDESIPAWQRDDLLFICVYTSAAQKEASAGSAASLSLTSVSRRAARPNCGRSVGTAAKPTSTTFAT